jgi:hypothetical protein
MWLGEMCPWSITACVFGRRIPDTLDTVMLGCPSEMVLVVVPHAGLMVCDTVELLEALHVAHIV